MIWLIGIVSFVIGLGIGAVIFKQYMSDAAKVELLEGELSKLQSEHEHYKNNVHAHFNSTAQAVNNLTDSYREVYRHLAAGAQSLCPESISKQLSFSINTDDLLGGQLSNNGGSYDDSLGKQYSSPTLDQDDMFPPRDYTDKASPDQKGSLAEDYGIEKSLSEETKDPSNAAPTPKDLKHY